MYRCQLCQCIVPPRTPRHHYVFKWRTRKYPYRPKANTFFRTEKRKRKKYQTDDPGGQGQEIVLRVSVCPNCAARNGQS